MMLRRKTSNLAWLFFGACYVIATLKIWMVYHDEITARQMWDDQSWYVEAAYHLLRGEWLGPYNNHTLLRQPGYPLWLAFLSSAKIPMRLGAEFLLAGAGYIFVVALRRARLPFWLCLLSYFLVVFQPESFHLNNEAWSETLYGPGLLLGISFLVLAYLAREKFTCPIYSGGAGFVFGWLWNARHENFLLYPVLLVFISALVWNVRNSEPALKKRKVQRYILSIALMAALILGWNRFVLEMNRNRYGVAVASEIVAPGFSAANSALTRIKQRHPNIFVPVPRESRMAAYKASPAFKKLEPFLEGDLGRDWGIWGCQALHVCDDLAGGWFFMALRDAAHHIGYYQSAVDTEKYYATISLEIDAACATGSLECHPKGLAFLGSYTNIHNLPAARHLIASFGRIMVLLWTSRPAINNYDNPDMVSPELQKIFDIVGQRRQDLVKTQKIRIKGWAFDPVDPVVKVEMIDGNSIVLETIEASHFSLRQDVLDHFKPSFGASMPELTGFQFQPLLQSHEVLEPRLAIQTKSGRQFQVSPFPESRIREGTFYSVDELEGFRVPPRWRILFQEGWTRAYDLSIETLTILSLALLIPYLLSRKGGRRNSDAEFILLLMTTAVLIRCIGLSLLDTTSFPIGQYFRLLYPVKLLYGPLVCVVFYVTAGSLISLVVSRFPSGIFFRKKGASTK